MPYFPRYFTLIPIIILSSLVLVGCQDAKKVSDCNQITQVTNSAKSLSVAQNSMQFIKLADSLDQLDLKVQAIAIKDQNLDGLKSKFSQLYKSMAQSARQLAEASTEKNPNLLLQSQQNLKTLTAQEIPLVAEVNKYCSQK